MKKFLKTLFVKVILISSSIWLVASSASVLNASDIYVSPSEATTIGKKIWYNEAEQKVAWLTWWNKGEAFASVGIGHFLWYPKNYRGSFSDTFPSFLRFAKHEGVEIPAWLEKTPNYACPWTSRTAFMNAQQSPEMQSLRTFLQETVALQTKFIIQRLDAALPAMLESVPVYQREHVVEQFYRVANSHGGLYPLIDYLNFKGEGAGVPSFAGRGWGLLQVLENMNGEGTGQAALEDFTNSAKSVLLRRVQYSSKPRQDAAWLPGWNKRLDTYAEL